MEKGKVLLLAESSQRLASPQSLLHRTHSSKHFNESWCHARRCVLVRVGESDDVEDLCCKLLTTFHVFFAVQGPFPRR